MKHPRKPKGWKGGLKDLAKAVEDMRYDRLSKFLEHLSDALLERSQKDLKRGRHILSCNLKIAAYNVLDAKAAIDDAWKVCEKHMEE